MSHSAYKSVLSGQYFEISNNTYSHLSEKVINNMPLDEGMYMRLLEDSDGTKLISIKRINILDTYRADCLYFRII